MMTPQEAWGIILQHVRPARTELIPLAEGVRRSLAEDVRADRDQPPTARSAMDGFAMRSSDCANPTCLLQITGEVQTGSLRLPRIRPGGCVRIYTGAAVPLGADAVVPLEATAECDGKVIISESVTRGTNIRKRGEEARKGDVLLACGAVLSPAGIGICAAVGKAKVRVFKQAGISIICTGQELRGPEEKIHDHQIRNANGPALAAALQESGFKQVHQEMAVDDLDQITSTIRLGQQRSKVIILTGGVSVGQYDLVPAAIRRAGGRIRLHGVAMKPGKPFLYATGTGGRHIFGLPGNPLAVLHGFYEMVLPALRVMAGCSPGASRQILTLPLAQAVRSRNSRTEYMLGQLVYDKSKGSMVRLIAWQGSADLAAAGRADGVFPVMPDAQLQAGDMVEFRLWENL